METKRAAVKTIGKWISSALLILLLICAAYTPMHADPSGEGEGTEAEILETGPDTYEWVSVYIPEDEDDRPGHGEYYLNINMAYARYMEDARAYYEEHPEEIEDMSDYQIEIMCSEMAITRLKAMLHPLEEDISVEYFVCVEPEDPQYKVKKVTTGPEGQEINFFPRDAGGDLDDESQYVMESHDYIDIMPQNDPSWVWVDEETAYVDFICYFGADLDINKYSDESHDFVRVYAQVSQEVITPATEFKDGEMKCTGTIVFPDPFTFLENTYTSTKTYPIPAWGNPERVTITEQPQSQDVEWPNGGTFHIEVDRPDLVVSYQWILRDHQGTPTALGGSTATTDTLVIPSIGIFIPYYDLSCVVTDIYGNKTESDAARLLVTNNGERKNVVFVCDEVLNPGETLDLSETDLGSGIIAYDADGENVTLSNVVLNTGGVRFDQALSFTGVMVEATAGGFDQFFIHVEGDCVINNEYQSDSGNNGVVLNGHFTSSENPDVNPLLVIDGNGTLTLQGGSVSVYTDSDLELNVDLKTQPLGKNNCAGIKAGSLHICPGANIDITSVGDAIVAQRNLYVEDAYLHIDAINHVSATANSEVEGILAGGAVILVNGTTEINMHADPERLLPAEKMVAYMYAVRCNSDVELYGAKLLINMQAETAEIPYANNFRGITGDYFSGLKLEEGARLEIRIRSDEVSNAAGIITDSSDYGSGVSVDEGSVLDIDIQTAGTVIGVDMPNRINVTDSTLKIKTSSADGGSVYALHAPSTAIELNEVGNTVMLQADNGVAVFLNDEDSAGTEYDPGYEPALLKIYGKGQIVVPENGLVSSYGYPMFGSIIPGETVYDPSNTEVPASEVVLAVPESIEGTAVVLSKTTYTYDGKTHKPAVETINGKTLTKGTDYTTEIRNSKGSVVTSPKTAGTYTVTVIGKGLYCGTASATFKISKATQTVTVSKTSYSKTFGNAAFSLGAKTNGDGTLKYSSDNTKVAKVSSAGKVTIKGAGTAKITIYAAASTNYNKSASKTVTIKVGKAANPLQIKTKTVTVKYSELSKKTQTLAVSKWITFVKKGKGFMTYTKASGDKNITINKNTGKITIKKGLKKGTYTVVVKVKAAGNGNYKASAVKKVTITIKVK